MTTNHTNNKIKTFSQCSWVEISSPYRAYMGTIVTALDLCNKAFVICNTHAEFIAVFHMPALSSTGGYERNIIPDKPLYLCAEMNFPRTVDLTLWILHNYCLLFFILIKYIKSLLIKILFKNFTFYFKEKQQNCMHTHLMKWVCMMRHLHHGDAMRRPIWGEYFHWSLYHIVCCIF